MQFKIGPRIVYADLKIFKSDCRKICTSCDMHKTRKQWNNQQWHVSITRTFGIQTWFVIPKASQDKLNLDSIHVQGKRSSIKWNKEQSPGQEITPDHVFEKQILTMLAWWTQLLTKVIPVFIQNQLIKNSGNIL